MSGIGLSGSHGSGKTTLAKAYAEAVGVKFLPSRASQIIIDAGRNPSEDYEFLDRMLLQELILASAIEDYEGANDSPFITDRTPLDFLTYLMTDISRNNVEGELAERFLNYQGQCFNAINRYFNVVVIIQPGIQLIDREGKGSANVVYAEHFNATISGLSVSSELAIQSTFIPRHCLDLDTRVSAVEQSVKVAFNSFERLSVKKGARNFSKAVH